MAVDPGVIEFDFQLGYTSQCLKKGYKLVFLCSPKHEMQGELL